MILLTSQIHFVLRANAIVHTVALVEGTAEPDPFPVLKLFNPVGAATWLATELDEDGDTLFGLADLGFGCPELSSFSLAELGAVRLPFGLAIERDLGFATTHRLSVWADTARRTGSIISAEATLRRAPTVPPDPDLTDSATPAPEIPPGPDPDPNADRP